MYAEDKPRRLKDQCRAGLNAGARRRLRCFWEGRHPVSLSPLDRGLPTTSPTAAARVRHYAKVLCDPHTSYTTDTAKPLMRVTRFDDSDVSDFFDGEVDDATI